MKGRRRRKKRSSGEGLVNVSGVSPGPERRVSDRRTMAAGSIQKHSCYEPVPGSFLCLATYQYS